jgi:GT2 family glycosyltransferase
VSVCIANWNCREMLRDCLVSLLHHEQGVSAEVIVVDNASTDGAADMVEREFPDVILIRNTENRGYARANNQAARRARGRYLFFLNNDTLVPPETLAQLVEEADRHPESGIVAPRLRDGQGRVQCSCRAFPTVGALLHRTCLFRWTGLFRRAYKRFRYRERDFDRRRRVDVVMGAALLVRRERFWRCGGWDEEYTFGGEDIDLCARIGPDHPVIYYPEAEVIHYGRVSSREAIEYAHGQTVIGITRFLRKSGTSPVAMLLYKAALTLDTPLRWLGCLAQYAWRRLRGRRSAATRSWLVVRALGHFLRRDLGTFWRV